MFVVLLAALSAQVINGPLDTSQAGDLDLHGLTDHSLSVSGNYLATLAESGKVVIWGTVGKRRRAYCVSTSVRPTEVTTAYEFSPATSICFDSTTDGRVYICNWEALYSWDWKRKRISGVVKFSEYKHLFGTSPTITRIAASLNGKYLALVDVQGNLYLLSIQAKSLHVYTSGRVIPDGCHYSVAFSPDSTHVVFTDRLNLKMLDLSNLDGKPTVIEQPQQGVDIEQIVFSPSGKMIATADKAGQIKVTDLRSGKHFVLNTGVKVTPCVSFSHDGAVLACGSQDGVLSVYSIQSRRLIARGRSNHSGFTGVGFLRDNRTLFTTGEDEHVSYWTMGEKVLRLVQPEP
jgi:WD40 repeat protein